MRTKYFLTIIYLLFSVIPCFSSYKFSDSIIIKNISGKVIEFSYVNEMYDQTVLVSKPQSITVIKTMKSVNLIQSNKFQNLYVLKEGDDLSLELNEFGNAIFKSRESFSRTEEINIYRHVNEQMKMTIFSFLLLYNKLNKNDFKNTYLLCDSFFKAKIDFLNTQIIENKFENRLLLEVKSTIIAEMLQAKIGTTIKNSNDLSIEIVKELDESCNNLDTSFYSNTQLASNFLFAKILYKVREKPTIDRILLEINSMSESPLKDILVFRFLKKAFDTCGSTTKANLNIYLNTLSESKYKTYLEKMRDDIEYAEYNKDSLVNQVGKKYLLSDIIGKLNAKLIYIDFWASWCTPCRVQMPHSLALSKKLSKNNIAFIYVSIDESFTSWQEASKKEMIPSSNNFWLPNFTKSKLAKQFKLSTIPRYIIAQSDGKVINQNAPRPSDASLLKLLKN